jgi:hypothetical protein
VSWQAACKGDVNLGSKLFWVGFRWNPHHCVLCPERGNRGAESGVNLESRKSGRKLEKGRGDAMPSASVEALRHEVILASELADSLILQADSVVTEPMPTVQSLQYPNSDCPLLFSLPISLPRALSCGLLRRLLMDLCSCNAGPPYGLPLAIFRVTSQ